jgi:hypothetical protein
MGIEGEVIEAFLCEVVARREGRWASRQRRKQEKGVNRDAANVAEVFRQCGRHWVDFLGDFLVFEGGDGGVN